MSKIATLFLFFLVITNCDSVTSPDDQNARFSLEIKQENIESIGDLKADFKVLNTSFVEQSYGFSSGCQFSFLIKKGGDTLFDAARFRACTAALTRFTLQPKESKTFTIDLKNVGNDSQEDLEKMGPGRYRLTAYLLKEQSPKVSRTFTIERALQN